MIGEVLSLDVNARSCAEKFIRNVLDLSATDIHMVLKKGDVQTSLRVNGLASPSDLLSNYSDVLRKSIFAEIQKMSNIPSGSMLPLTGSFILDGHTFRTSSIPLSKDSSKLSIRILKNNMISNVGELGYPKDFIKSFKTILRTEQSGIILFSGATGSGKSTAMAAFIQEITNIGKTVFTLEDPIEYEIDGAFQIEVSESFSFEKALRELLRQDPDIFIIGEIRDEVVARSAIEFARSGHLVISTIHANDLSSIESRLKTLGVNEADIRDLIKFRAFFMKQEGTNVPRVNWEQS